MKHLRYDSDLSMLQILYYSVGGPWKLGKVKLLTSTATQAQYRQCKKTLFLLKTIWYRDKLPLYHSFHTKWKPTFNVYIGDSWSTLSLIKCVASWEWDYSITASMFWWHKFACAIQFHMTQGIHCQLIHVAQKLTTNAIGIVLESLW